MDKSFGIHIAHSFHKLPEQIQSFLFINSFFYDICKSTSWAILNEQVNIILNYMIAIKPHNIWMRKCGEFLESFNLIFENFWLVQMFDCYFIFVLVIISLVNMPKTAIPKVPTFVNWESLCNRLQFLRRIHVYYLPLLKILSKNNIQRIL